MSQYKHTNVFHRSDVSWFPVPNGLFKGTPPLIEKLSAGALRLYLFLLSRAGASPNVTVSNADVAKYARVTKTNVKKTRSELVKHHLVRVSKDGRNFQISNPKHGDRLPSALEKVKAGPYTEKQVESVFMHFIGQNRLDDNENGMLFICPFHNVGVNSNTKRKKNPLSVKRSTSGVWQCTDPKCKCHGKRKTQLIEDSWGEPIAETVVAGGGDLLDFVAAMSQLVDGEPITRQQAAQILIEILTNSIPAEI